MKREMIKVNDYLMDPSNKFGDRTPTIRRIVCRDGFTLSVQANQFAYCSPRSNNGPWTQVEVGYPSAPPEFIMEFADEADYPTDTIYAFVPIDYVQKLVDFHGGIAIDANRTLSFDPVTTVYDNDSDGVFTASGNIG